MKTRIEFIDAFYRELDIRNYSKNTIDTYTGYLAQFLLAMNGKAKRRCTWLYKNFSIIYRKHKYSWHVCDCDKKFL
jgi:hypothetical protein